MNDDLISRLDDRGRAAGSTAHAAVAELPIPDFDPDLVRVSLDDDPTTGAAGPGGRGDRRWLAVVGIAAALLVVALGAALASRAGDDDSAPTDNVGTTTPVRPYVAGWLPEGLQVSSVTDRDGSAESRSPYGFAVFGPSVDDPRLGIVSIGGSSPIEEQIAQGDESYRSVGTVAGREVFTRDERPATFVFAEGDQQVVILPAEGVDESTVLDVVAALEVDGDEVTLADPPEGWERLGDVDDPFFAATDGLADSYHVTYTGPLVESDDGVLLTFASVSTSPGSPLAVAMLRLLTHSAEEVVVRGHPAVLARTDTDPDAEPVVPEWVVSWEETPGEVIQVSGVALGREDVLALAEDVHPATEAELDELSRASVITPGSNEELVGSGQFSDGSLWALMVTDEGTSGSWASLNTLADGSDTASAGSATGSAINAEGEPIDVEAPALPEVTSGGGDAFGWAYGLLDPTSGAAVTRVVVEDASGVVAAEAVLVGEGDVRGWVVELPAGLVPSHDGSDDDVAGSSSSGSGSSGGSSDSATTTYAEGVATTAGAGEVEEVDGPTVVAYAADGTELARQPLP